MPHLQRTMLRYTPIEPTASHRKILAQLAHEHLRRLAREASSLPYERQHDERRFAIRRGRVHGLRLCFRDRSPGSRGGVASKGDVRRVQDLFDLAADGEAAQISAFLPGTNEAIRIAVEYHMRIIFPMVLVSRAISAIGPGIFREIRFYVIAALWALLSGEPNGYTP
jgi:hypothetical protein